MKKRIAIIIVAVLAGVGCGDTTADVANVAEKIKGVALSVITESAHMKQFHKQYKMNIRQSVKSGTWGTREQQRRQQIGIVTTVSRNFREGYYEYDSGKMVYPGEQLYQKLVMVQVNATQAEFEKIKQEEIQKAEKYKKRYLSFIETGIYPEEVES